MELQSTNPTANELQLRKVELQRAEAAQIVT
jgi:hypothetical protein